MTQPRFGDETCHKFKSKLDSFVDNELLAESNFEIVQHFTSCQSCTREAQDLRYVRRRLQNAVRDIPVPGGLNLRVRNRLRQSQRPQPKKLFLMAIAAALVLYLGILRFGDPNRKLLRIAFDDHVHCAVIHQPAPRVPLKANQLLAQLKGLTALVQERVPSEFAVILAHECRDQGRTFIHLTLGDGRHLVSVVITRRENGESLGNRMRLAAREHFQLAAIETEHFFVYTVSDLPAPANADLLASFAPSLRAFLTEG